ncbi:MAG TPA: magnesium transporter [Pelomicrobium sp.]|nr:magnesium transporter [Pelomicrobium sp.]
MAADASAAVAALETRFLRGYPQEAARRLEAMPLDEIADTLASQPVNVALPVWEQLATYVQEALVERLPDDTLKGLMSTMDPPLAAELLVGMDAAVRLRALTHMEPGARQLAESLMEYGNDTAGRLMDPRVVSFRGDMTVGEALARMRTFARSRSLRELFLTDDEGALTGRVEIQDIAISPPDEPLRRIAKPVAAAVLDVAARDEVVQKIEQHRVSVLPVVSVSGRLMGVIHPTTLFAAVQEDASLDIQTMVGASKDERALSKVSFAVRKRLPWLQINLATAFLAAAVVGLFEDTIAKFTALAVLLPVVAGQSGNAGAQALAVTMRGLALREISVRQLPRMLFKEVNVGLLNGIAVAVTTAIGVYFWSGSVGLVLVIAIAMVVSMVAAGFSGAMIPIALQRFGMDPATASSILLTTVTDVVGFFSFLGVATMLQAML